MFLSLFLFLSIGGEAKATMDSCMDTCLGGKSITAANADVSTSCVGLANLKAGNDVSCTLTDVSNKIKKKNVDTVTQCMTSCVFVEDKKEDGIFSNCEKGTGQTNCNITVSDTPSITDPGYDTKKFYLHAGFVKLSPYSIILDKSSGATPNTYTLDNSSENNVTSFVEFVYKNRMAWVRENRYKHDIEFKFGIYDSTNSKKTSAVVSGANDMAIELSYGVPLCIIPGLCKYGNKAVNKISHTVNLEMMYGMITDRKSNNVYDSKHLGLVGVIAIPTKTGKNDKYDRTNELLLGLYKGEIDTPKFINKTSREVEVEYGNIPVYEKTEVVTLRAEFHLALKKNAYIVLAGRAHKYPHNEYRATPWTVSASVTIPIMDIFAGITNMASD